MTDEEIVDAVLRGNTHVFAALVDLYKDRVFSMVYRFTNDYSEAQDVSQEVFIQVFKNLHLFNEKSKFSTWLYKVAYNLCIDWTRKRKKAGKSIPGESGIYDEDILLRSDKSYNIEDDYLSRLRITALRSAVNGLKDKYRTVIILFHYQGFSYEEIGEILNISVRTVETRIYRARNLLRKSLLMANSGGDFNEMPSNI